MILIKGYRVGVSGSEGKPQRCGGTSGYVRLNVKKGRSLYRIFGVCGVQMQLVSYRRQGGVIWVWRRIQSFVSGGVLNVGLLIESRTQPEPYISANMVSTFLSPRDGTGNCGLQAF